MSHNAQGNGGLHCNIIDHPLARTNLRIMRDENTDQVSFCAAVKKLTPLLVYAATTDLALMNTEIKTPIASMIAQEISERIVLVPILRSGFGMVEPTKEIFPKATIICAGMARDEKTAIPYWYYAIKALSKLDGGIGAVFLVLDPMLATGGSAIETMKEIKSVYPAGSIKMISMIAAPEGIKALNNAYPDVQITVAAVDDHLNQVKYIVPGLGDAGDRQFGTV